MKKIVVSAKNVQKAIDEALKQLGVNQEDVDIHILDEGGFFRKAKVEVSCDFLDDETEKAKVEKVDKKEEKKKEKLDKKEEEKAENNKENSIIEVAKEFLIKLANKMNITCEIDFVETENGVIFNASGENVGGLIGKRGETLNAIQEILSNYTRNKGFKERVFFDVENYKNRREVSLTSLAEKMALKAVRSGKRVRLEPMTAYERKIIHTTLQNYEGVTTKSEGEEPNRYLVIIPKDVE